ncbi:MAG: tetratricopeptide repeat protein [Sedimentisphaerales bacterium]|jgi:tetratricopeptide (TPR) repeat protein|nr:tetratricopeptide repeat protein [Sedimentisphaerales bacterium]
MDRFSRLEFGDTRPKGPLDAGLQIRDADFFVQEARRYWLAGDFELALRAFSRALEQDRTRLEGWAGQVLMLIELGEYKEAEVWAARALDLFPDHPDLLALRAIALARDAKLKQALVCSDKAIAAEKTTSWAWLARAEVFMHKSQAVVTGCISKAIAIAAGDLPIIRLYAGMILRRIEAYVEASKYLQEVVTAVPAAALAWYELAICQQALGLPQAQVSLQQALRINPHFAPAKKAMSRLKRGGRLS